MYDPAEDDGVRDLDEAGSDEERLERERALLAESDNGAKDTDPEDAS